MDKTLNTKELENKVTDIYYKLKDFFDLLEDNLFEEDMYYLYNIENFITKKNNFNTIIFKPKFDQLSKIMDNGTDNNSLLPFNKISTSFSTKDIETTFDTYVKSNLITKPPIIKIDISRKKAVGYVIYTLKDKSSNTSDEYRIFRETFNKYFNSILKNPTEIKKSKEQSFSLKHFVDMTKEIYIEDIELKLELMIGKLFNLEGGLDNGQ